MQSDEQIQSDREESGITLRPTDPRNPGVPGIPGANPGPDDPGRTEPNLDHEVKVARDDKGS